MLQTQSTEEQDIDWKRLKIYSTVLAGKGFNRENIAVHWILVYVGQFQSIL